MPANRGSSHRPWCELSDIAHVGLGYKSLQNDFFYLTSDVIGRFSIEAKFLIPIYRFRDFRGDKFEQDSEICTWVFVCNEPEEYIRGTGALRYIRHMEKQPATQKKQGKDPQTMSEVLRKQGGTFWYGPKAQPHPKRIWVRKAIDAVYAPFVCKDESVVDQRCNYVAAGEECSWQEIASLLTSSVFAFSAECSGACALGAGALELPTTILRSVRVPDIRSWKDLERHELVRLGQAVWTTEAPIDWSRMLPEKLQRELDELVLRGLGGGVRLDQLYGDLSDLCAARRSLSSQKEGKIRAAETRDVAQVVRSIVDGVEALVASRQFPIGFMDSTMESIGVQLPEGRPLAFETSAFMGHVLVTIRDSDSEACYWESEVSSAVAECVARALLSGQRAFRVPVGQAEAQSLCAKHVEWLSALQSQIEDRVRGTAFGTRFEQRVRTEVMSGLGLEPLLFESEVPGKFLVGARRGRSSVER